MSCGNISRRGSRLREEGHRGQVGVCLGCTGGHEEMAGKGSWRREEGESEIGHEGQGCQTAQGPWPWLRVGFSLGRDGKQSGGMSSFRLLHRQQTVGGLGQTGKLIRRQYSR